MRGRRGISPVIATVIIVAVAIVVSLAVASWIMGLWSGLGQTEALEVLPSSYIDVGASQLVLDIRNTGSMDAEIYKIEVNGVDVGTTYPYVVPAGGRTQITVDLTNSGLTLAAGVAYTVSIYTEAGNIYTTVVFGR